MQSTQGIEDRISEQELNSVVRMERPEWSFQSMIGRSQIMQRLFAQMRYTAAHLRIATIEGESGSGKALAASTLHSLGPASSGRFFACSAQRFFEQMSASVRESRDGTLLISRIESLTPEQQLRLLDFLQWFDHQNALRTPDTTPRQLFFSTNQPLRKLTAASALRIDLAHRISAIRFSMPPLRDRRDDIALLADHFAHRFAAIHGKPVRGLGPQTLPKLLIHTWPGNVRELESVISIAALDCEGQWIRPIDLPALTLALQSRTPEQSLAAGQSAGDLNLADPNLDRVILRHIRRILAHVDGNKLRAARLLGISRSTLYRLLENREENREQETEDKARSASGKLASGILDRSAI